MAFERLSGGLPIQGPQAQRAIGLAREDAIAGRVEGRVHSPGTNLRSLDGPVLVGDVEKIDAAELVDDQQSRPVARMESDFDRIEAREAKLRHETGLLGKRRAENEKQ